MGITYRKCELQDLEELQELSKSTFSIAFEKDNDPKDFQSYLNKAFSGQQLRGELKNLNTIFYFVETDNEIIGYLKINLGDAQNELKESKGVELERIYVISSCQGKGLGQQMLAFVEDLVRQQNKDYLWLGVWERNVRAIQFYERHGYVKFGTHPYYVGSDKQTDWLLKKEFK